MSGAGLVMGGTGKNGREPCWAGLWGDYAAQKRDWCGVRAQGHIDSVTEGCFPTGVSRREKQQPGKKSKQTGWRGGLVGTHERLS